MARAERVHSTPPTNLSLADPVHAATETYRPPLRGYLAEALAIAFILIAGGTTSCLIAVHLEGRLAAACARDLQRVSP